MLDPEKYGAQVSTAAQEQISNRTFKHQSMPKTKLELQGTRGPVQNPQCREDM